MEKILDTAVDMDFYTYQREHVRLVRKLLMKIIDELDNRAWNHDFSKLEEPEQSLFMEKHDSTLNIPFASVEYEKAVSELSEAYKLHHKNNRHHPEHFENGVSGMNLVDLLEMVCDWVSASKMRDRPVNLEYGKDKFQINDQLFFIIQNTVEFLEK